MCHPNIIVMKKIASGIIVDGFTIKQQNTIYFLTHWHADHYMGISNKWPYGPIYTSQMTKKFLLTKYPKLQDNVEGLQLNKVYQIENPKNKEIFTIKLFDSNHMAGSVMILFQFKNGSTILNTGDMRFNAAVLKNQTELFQWVPKSKQYRCKYQIDKLYLDNTYCDPIFQFPNRSDAITMAKDIIDKHKQKMPRIYLITHTIGKQEALIALSLHYKTKIVVCQERYAYTLQILEGKTKSFFTTNQTQGWIQVIKSGQKEIALKLENSVIITLTGWANLRDYHEFSTKQYIVPYSLHSNYQELQLFVSVVRPKKIYPIVDHHDERKSTDFRQTIHSYGSYFGSLMHMKQRGFQFLQEHYHDTYFSEDQNMVMNQ